MVVEHGEFGAHTPGPGAVGSQRPIVMEMAELQLVASTTSDTERTWGFWC